MSNNTALARVHLGPRALTWGGALGVRHLGCGTWGGVCFLLGVVVRWCVGVLVVGALVL